MSLPDERNKSLYILRKSHLEEEIIEHFDDRSMSFSERNIFTKRKESESFFGFIEERLSESHKPPKERAEPGPQWIPPPPPTPEDRADDLKAALDAAFAAAPPTDPKALGQTIKDTLERIGYHAWQFHEVSLVLGPNLYRWCRDALTPLHDQDGAELPPPYPSALPDRERIVGHLLGLEVWASALTSVPHLRYPDPKDSEAILVVTLPPLWR
jgi:hypothetical protein